MKKFIAMRDDKAYEFMAANRADAMRILMGSGRIDHVIVWEQPTPVTIEKLAETDDVTHITTTKK